MPSITVDGRDIKVSRLDKELFPADHRSKGDVIAHYRAVASAMLPHLAGRPLTMRRYPDGIDEGGFFQKDASDYFPEWIRTEKVRAQNESGSVDYVICEDEATLVYLANQAAVEFHVWPATLDDLERPDRLVIDIDPPDGTAAAVLHKVARRLRDVYTEIGLAPFVQATGGRGYHVVAPLDRSTGFEAVRELALAIADRLAAEDPNLLTTAQRKNKRGDRIFLDVNRNGQGQTFVAPYSLRARPGAAVATPLDWDELGRSEPARYTTDRIKRRLVRKSDPWSAMDDQAASAEEALEELG
ncbi:bifunctional non-homologous end joining protein LigD [Glycomyces sambucus]|uniref:Bifunctional non-homologous end joining protein LigD n=1 Tax=Glycomyces sambucus TaxID=380244 RepID=A0A1G9LY13_9ACTN|nr:non-homologous end-joining DNA ligase [Glycomyces sambucus]SDL66577.1 bifunctional non-homologous end joining protein LigD [Glycomyces sambucus]